MKRKIADLSDWNRKMRKTYNQMEVDEHDFKGIVTCVQFHEVEEPIWYQPNEAYRYLLVDDGYAWLQYFPSEAHYAVTTVIHSNGELIHHYVDIHAGSGVTVDGVPYFDDLFLDLVILPTGEQFVLDTDELEEAREQAVITTEQYEQAYQTLQALQREIEDAGTAWLCRWERDAEQLSRRVPMK